MNKEKIAKQAVGLAKKITVSYPVTHDWWHIHRVLKLAIKIGKQEGADLFLTKLIALTHDLDDWKFGRKKQPAVPWLLKKLKIGSTTQNRITQALSQISYKGLKHNVRPTSLEGRIVQDADRLDALGAMGIARCFAYGAKINRPFFDPAIKPQPLMGQKTYRQKTTDKTCQLT